MSASLFHINIEYKNGLYTTKDFEGDSLEEIERAVLSQEGDEVIITYNKI